MHSFISAEYRNLVQYVKRYLNERYYCITAEDVIQDVALNLFTKFDVDSKVENIAGYVYRSIRNRITDIQRKRKTELPYEERKGAESNYTIEMLLQHSNEASFDLVDADRIYEKVYEALAQLSPNQQAVFVATELEGYTFEELAEAWNIPIGTLLSWKHRGVKKMQELIKLEDFYNELEQN